MRGDTKRFDALLKLLIQGASEEPFRQLRVGNVREWLNSDLPRIRSRRADLLGRTAAGRLLHIELQSTNDPLIPLRMAEYGLAIMRAYGEYPEQLVLNIGNERLRIAPGLRTPGLVCEYRQVDIRELDGAALLASGRIADNIMAILAGLRDAGEGIRRVLRRIVRLPKGQRQSALDLLLLTCGIRGLETLAGKELENMPVTFDFDLTRYKFIASALRERQREAREKGITEGRREGLRLGREEGRRKGHREGVREGRRQGLQEGRREGLQEGLKEGHKEGINEGERHGVLQGRQEGIREVVRLQLEKRFGRLPAAIAKRLVKLTEKEAGRLALAILDASSVEQLFPGRTAPRARRRVTRT